MIISSADPRGFGLPNGRVRYVDQMHPNAADSGEGAHSAPYKTITYAMNNLLVGETLRIAGGTYREQVTFPSLSWSNTNRTTIEGDYFHRPMIVGTDVVDGWESVDDGLYKKTNWTIQPQQVAIDGVLLQQINGTVFGGYPDIPVAGVPSVPDSWPGRVAGDETSMPNDSFYWSGNDLYIKHSKKTTPVIEVAVRSNCVLGNNISGVTVRNICAKHSNQSTFGRLGTITLNGNYLLIENIIVHQPDSIGIHSAGNNNIIKNNKVFDSGRLGMAIKGNNVLMTGNEMAGCNTRGFNKNWEAGGLKSAGEGGMYNSTIVRNEAHHNLGDGFWWDYATGPNTIVGNIAAYNTGHGIHYEVSGSGYIFNNFTFKNGQRGIYAISSSNCWIAHNMVMQNGLEPIVVVTDLRGDADDCFVAGNIIGWSAAGYRDIVLADVDYMNYSDGNLLLGGVTPTFSRGWFASPNGGPTVNFANWKLNYGHDVHSDVISAVMPQLLLDDLSSGSMYPDWGELETWTLDFTVVTSFPSSGLPAWLKIKDRVGPGF